MFADAILLGWMAMSYKYVDYTTGKVVNFANILWAGVNFTNVKCTNFLYERRFSMYM